MIEVKEVKSSKQQREFVNFPLRLYKNNPYFVPPLYADEMKLFKSNYHYYETSEAVYFLAYRNGEVVGRISGILQRAANEKWQQKRVRFTRFDSIDDQEVANALFSAVETWAKAKGMEEVVGPLGFPISSAKACSSKALRSSPPSKSSTTTPTIRSASKI